MSSENSNGYSKQSLNVFCADEKYLCTKEIVSILETASRIKQERTSVGKMLRKTKQFHNKAIETIDPEELKKLQEQKLREQIKYTYEKSKFINRSLKKWA
jgi:hypothetical protein